MVLPQIEQVATLIKLQSVDDATKVELLNYFIKKIKEASEKEH